MEPEFLFLIPISLFILLVTAILISGDSYPNLVAALMTPQHSGATIAGLAISVLVVVLILSIPSSLFLFMKAHGATITPWLSSDWALTLALFASWMLYKLRQRAALLYGFL
jgi:hypothetical protein